MRKKRKPKKKKGESLKPLSTDEEELLYSFLENLKDINLSNIKEHINSPEFARIVLDRLPAGEPETVNLIFAIRDAFEHKNVQKAVKKAIFRLKQKGLSFPEHEIQKKAPLIFKRPENAEPIAYIGTIDGIGSRGVLLMAPHAPKGIDIGIGVVRSEDGINYFIYDRYSKKRSREIKEFFFEQSGLAVETSVSHAATILENAYKKNKLKTGESSGDYLKLRPWILENIPLLDRAAIYEFIDPDSIAVETLTDSRIEKLLGHELLESWIIGPEKIQPVLDEILKVEESPIIITQEQKTNRIGEIKEKAIAEIYPRPKRLILKEDLEEMAFIFFRIDGEEYARLCLASAMTMDEEDSPIRINTFLKLSMERSLDHCISIIEEKDKPEELKNNSASTIIIP
ncbi:hypothetical protein ACFL0H_02160 [Thermodesulfobacteriota bacterium]